MPKIETPEEFAKKLSDCQHTAPYIASLITARDAAIRAERDALLKTCGEALGVAHKALEHDIPGSCWAEGPEDPNNPEHYDHTCPGCRGLAWINKALAALKDAGVL